MTGLTQDFRYAFGQLRKNPAFGCTSILTVSLGLCASLAIFGFVDAALIRPLPYPGADRLVEVTESAAVFPRANLSYLDYLDWKRLNHAFISIDVFSEDSYLLHTAAGS